jgi:heme O synthase-like polyprenyltransferase
MLPNVAGVARTKREIFAYALALGTMSLALYPCHVLGPCYRGAAAVLGSIFLHQSWRIFDDPGKRWPRALLKRCA